MKNPTKPDKTRHFFKNRPSSGASLPPEGSHDAHKYGDYRQKTDREIPVVRLTPAPPSPS